MVSSAVASGPQDGPAGPMLLRGQNRGLKRLLNDAPTVIGCWGSRCEEFENGVWACGGWGRK